MRTERIGRDSRAVLLAAVCAASCLVGRQSAAAAGLGPVTAVAHDTRSVTMSVGDDKLVVRVCTPQIIRIEYRRGGRTDADTPVLDPAQKWDAPVNAKVDADGDPVVLRTDAMTVQIARNPCRVTVLDAAGKTLLAEPAAGGVYVDPDAAGRGGLRFTHAAGRPFYGVKAFDIGGSYRDPAAGSLVRGGKPDAVAFQANAATQGGAGAPFLWTTGGFGVLVDADNGFFTATDKTVAFDYGTPGPETNGRRFDRPNTLSYFVFVGPPKDLFAGLANATGRPPMFPKWATGFTNSQWGITQDAAITAVDEYRARDIPIDNFTFDFDWKAWGEDDYGEFRWNRQKFPAAVEGSADAQPLLAKMQARGMHMTGIMKPRIVRFLDKAGQGPPTKQGKYADDHGFWVKGLESHRDYQSGMPCGELDFIKPEVRAWFWQNTKSHGAMQAGISGFWNDEADEASTKNGSVVFNNFEHAFMQRSLYDGQRAWTENGHVVSRVWSINRNFYLGAQRYAYGLWSGDINTGFDSMARQAGRMLAAVSVGESKWGMDTGGFNGTPMPENYARWVQFASMVPVCRVHGTIQEHRQPWLYGERAGAAAKAALRLRYALAPYVYAAERGAYDDGLGLVRPLDIAFPDDAGSADITDEWMFGDGLLAAPVLAKQAFAAGPSTARMVYLPPGAWVDYFRGNSIEGGRTISYPANPGVWNDLPLFVRRGAILTTQDVVPSLGSAKPERLYLDVFPDPDETATTVYDDDGQTYAYEKDGFFKQRVTAKGYADGADVTLAPKQGGYTPTFKDYVVKLHGRAAAAATLNGRPMTEITDPALVATTDNAFARGRDVYGDYTVARVPAGVTDAVRLVLSGNKPVDSDVEAIEAESGSFSGQTVDTTLPVAKDHAGYTGTGFASGFSRPHGAVTLSVRRRAAGTYAATVRVANKGNPHEPEQTLGLYVNGTRVRTLVVPVTGDWGAWQDLPLDLPLAAGDNAVMLRRDPEDTGGANVDCLHVPFEPAAAVYEAEAGELIGPEHTNNDHANYTGGGFVDQFEQDGAGVRIAVSVPKAGDYVVTTRYGNGRWGEKSLSLLVNGTKAASLKFPQLDGWDAWADLPTTVTLKAGENAVTFTRQPGDTGGLNVDRIEVTAAK